MALALVSFFGGAIAPGQQPPEQATVRDLNARILALSDRSARPPQVTSGVRSRSGRTGPARGGSSQNTSQEAAELISRRQAALERLIAADAAAAIALAFPQNVLDDLAARYPVSAAKLESHGTWRGPVEHLIYDGKDMVTYRSLRRLRHGGQWLEFHFAGREAAVMSGDVLRIRGMRAGNSVAVTEATIEGSIWTPSMAKLSVAHATGGTCSSSGEQRIAVILVDFPGVTNPAGVTAQSVSDIYFGSGVRSLNDYWNEASYGGTWASGSVFGPYTLDQVYTCDMSGYIPAAAMAAANADVNFQDYSRLIFVSPVSGCWWSGISSVGCSQVNTPDGTVTASTTSLVSNYLTVRDSAVALAAHEGGHSLGLLHARRRDFGTEALGPIGTIGSPGEYGDSFSAMGASSLGHYSAPHKAGALGWMLENLHYQVVQSSGVYTVQPIEPGASGVQALKIARDAASGSWLWLEYRQPLGGYDPALSSQVFSGALIHYQDPETTSTGARTDLLDFTPATDAWSDPALAAGQEWSDPYSDLVIQVESATASELRVRVSYGSGTPCTRANPTVGISPANPSANANSNISYTVSVVNRDSATCAAGTFTFGSSQPAGWATSFSPGALTLGPGESGTVTMTKSVPPGTPSATYPVDAAAANGAYSASATANITVVSPSSKISASTDGSGILFSDDGLINCPGDCVESYTLGSQVTLGVSPDRNWRFDHWEGDCSGAAVNCVVNTMGNRNVKAVFARTNGGGGSGGGGGGNGGGNGGGPKK